jgi:hypothetical protein
MLLLLLLLLWLDCIKQQGRPKELPAPLLSVAQVVLVVGYSGSVQLCR